MLHNYIAFGNFSTKFQTIFFSENSAFFQNFGVKILIKIALRMLEIAFRGLKFQNFQGEDTPGPPNLCEVLELCISQPTRWIYPWAWNDPGPILVTQYIL